MEQTTTRYARCDLQHCWNADRPGPARRVLPPDAFHQAGGAVQLALLTCPAPIATSVRPVGRVRLERDHHHLSGQAGLPFVPSHSGLYSQATTCHPPPRRYRFHHRANVRTLGLTRRLRSAPHRTAHARSRTRPLIGSLARYGDDRRPAHAARIAARALQHLRHARRPSKAHRRARGATARPGRQGRECVSLPFLLLLLLLLQGCVD